MSSNHNPFQAVACPHACIRVRGTSYELRGYRTVREASIYPVVPANYPNRQVRRLVARKRIDLLPTEWRIHLTPLILHLQ